MSAEGEKENASEKLMRWINRACKAETGRDDLVDLLRRAEEALRRFALKCKIVEELRTEILAKVAEIRAADKAALAATEWKDLPKDVLEDMAWLGQFGPTLRVENRELKGSMTDADGDRCKTYLNASDARRLAKSLNAAADWLDARAEATSP